MSDCPRQKRRAALLTLTASLLSVAVVFAQAPPVATTDSATAQSAPAPTTAAPQAATPTAPAAAVEKGTAAEVPLAHKPYNVVVEIGFDGEEAADFHIRQTLTNEIRNGLRRMYGAMWNAQVKSSEWFIPASIQRLERLTEGDLISHTADPTLEKLMLISVSGRQGTFEVGCREFDTRVQELSPLITEATQDLQSVANVACRMARDSFRPVLLLSGPSVDKSELEFHLQAGTITPPDPSAAQIAEGDVLRTFLRQLDRRNPGKVKLLQRLDLCYVRVTSFNQELRSDSLSATDVDVTLENTAIDPSAVYADSGHVKGVLISHGLVPFGGRGRNMQQIGLRQRPSAGKSRVRMVLQARPDRPLICFRVDRVAKLRQTDVNEEPGVRMLSDRNGDIEIEVDPKNPTFWLYVYSGSVLLARVPYAPGLIPQDTMKLPDDSVRLGVEGELYLLRDQLVDMVAQKAVHMSLAKKAAAEGNVEGLEAAIAQLDALPGQKRFEDLLNLTRSEAVAKADLQKNPGAKRKVENLCKKMGESLTLFFSPEKRLKEAEELEKIRQSAGTRATAPAAQ